MITKGVGDSVKRIQFYPFLSKGCAFFATAVAGEGLYLKVLYVDGTSEELPTSAHSFLHGIVQFFGYDIVAMRKQYGQAIGKSQMVPLPLTEDWILTPFKVASKPEDEFTMGWVIAQAIIGINSENRAVTKFSLKGNHTLYCAHGVNYCKQQLRHVALVQHRYQFLHHKGDSFTAKEEQIPYLGI